MFWQTIDRTRQIGRLNKRWMIKEAIMSRENMPIIPVR